MRITVEISTLSIWVQCAAEVFILLLFLLLSRGDAPAFHRRWTAGWGALAIALTAAGLGFTSAPPATIWAYQFSELVFVSALCQGAHTLAGRSTLRSRSILPMIAALAVCTTAFSAFLTTSSEPGLTLLPNTDAVHTSRRLSRLNRQLQSSRERPAPSS